MSKPISPELQALIDAFVGADQYDSANDLLKAIHTRLEDPQTREAVSNAWLKRKLELADVKGGGHTVEEVF